MKATYFLGNETFEVREVPIPKAKPGTVVVKNYACGVCGTDVHIYHGEPGSADVNPPVVLGHEYSGVITEVGEGVNGLKVGDHVTIDPNIYCGECEYCRNGKKQMCPSMQAVGVTMDGGFAEYSVVPASQALVLDPEVPLEYGAMSEPLACCIHGIDLAQIKLGDTVCVVGGGAIGMLLLQLARLSGASKVVVSEPNEGRRQKALELGADLCINPLEEGYYEKYLEFIGGEGADVVIECAGNRAAVNSAFKFAKRGAMILLFSVPSVGATYDLPLMDVFKKELTIRGTFVNPDTHLRAVQLINSGRIKIAPIITHTFTRDQIPEAIDMQVSAESIKVIVKA